MDLGLKTERIGNKRMLLMIYAYYQDSDNTDSPVSSESDVHDDGGDKGRKQKKKKNNGVELEVGLKFIDKEQLREAVEDYRIMKGYDIRITHSDKKRFIGASFQDSSTCAEAAFAGPETASGAVTYVRATLGHTVSIVLAYASTIETRNEPIVELASHEPVFKTAIPEIAAQF
ncbi:hypothetical protein Cgig2_028244 [Carnegiea gigantea]|uniref:Transposase MuDR plant domain-containing protein n=1 Tax=Carnegiea gigantea TaxID=171969 RepID=A0A9Q1KF08_9CARY|nr:hypothetical protein Cgig2_028244 [Carnegiea gigantea]